MKRGQIWGLVVGVVVSATVAWPITLDPKQDSFPLSTYPMFASKREKVWVHVAVGIDAEGELHRLGPALLGTREVMQAAQTIAKAVRSGKKRRKELCAAIAERLAEDPGGIVRVELRSLKYDAVAYFMDPEPTPIKARRRASCSVPEGS